MKQERGEERTFLVLRNLKISLDRIQLCKKLGCMINTIDDIPTRRERMYRPFDELVELRKVRDQTYSGLTISLIGYLSNHRTRSRILASN